VARLAQGMVERWHCGERPFVEDVLAEHKELLRRMDVVLDLVYEEICLRSENGAPASPEEYHCRFPLWIDELNAIFACHNLLDIRSAAPRFPAVGESLGEFRLLAVLGRGSQGSVFLATQPSLANRPVVLKVAPIHGCEHLSLARLQHTHIVPLYAAVDDEPRGLRALCMPYFGSANLGRVLDGIQQIPMRERTGKQLLDVVDRADKTAPVKLAPEGPAREFIARASYVQALCWIVTCLADALHYAHQRGLVHLDVKPANVLLAADGQPMLLDFHLAQAPITPDGPPPPRIGGTLAFMPPEQHAAVAALGEGKPIPRAVDHRADIFSLGVMLYDALGGTLPVVPGKSPPLVQLDPSLSLGLSDIAQRCLAFDAADRYPDGAAVAEDLRRYLGDLPLRGVANRSVTERWRKWRRRRPFALLLVGLLLVASVAFVALGSGAAFHCRQNIRESRAAYADGQERLRKGDTEAAVAAFSRGIGLLEHIPFQEDLRDELVENLSIARRDQAIEELHLVADRIRMLGSEAIASPRDLQSLERACRACWDRRQEIGQRLGGAPDANGLHRQVHADLLDLAILWTDLHVRSASPGATAMARTEALQVLDQAEVLFGSSAALTRERRKHIGTASGVEPTSQLVESTPQNAWEHYDQGRALLQSTTGLPGDTWFALVRAVLLVQAKREFERAAGMDPQGLWPNYYLGLCDFQLGRYDEAIAAFSVGIGLNSKLAHCFYHRALCWSSVGRIEQAVSDYGEAIRLEESHDETRCHSLLAAATLNRGMLLSRLGRHELAIEDLKRAQTFGAPTATVHYDSALIRLRQEYETQLEVASTRPLMPCGAISAILLRAQFHRSEAIAELREALNAEPTHSEARALLKRLHSTR
jgi:serine/threonine protein kinase